MDRSALTLRTSPVAWTSGERLAFWALAVLVAATRALAVSKSLWDWDEALFALAVRDYDVTAHHPHPPGFPLFILAAKSMAATFGTGEFRSLQALTVLSSMLVFPAMVFLAQEMRLGARTAIAAGLVLSFLPNVWFYGGTAFSDIPSLVLAMAACALLLRGCRHDPSLFAGALLLGIAAGFRPQNLLIAFVPALLALWHRRQVAAAALALTGALVVASYGGAAQASGGWTAYRDTVSRHEQYIRETDSFLAPRHPGLLQVADDFFLRPFRAPVINVAIILLAAVAVLRRRGLFAVAIFGPFLLFAWLFLDFHSASRFSIGYMPLFATLAAAGLPARRSSAALAALVLLMIVWSWPALHIVRTTDSPPVAAIHALRSLHQGPVLVDERLAAHADLLLADYDRRVVHVAPPFVADPDALLLREGTSTAGGALTFTRARERLAGVARQRYFETSLVRGRRPATTR